MSKNSAYSWAQQLGHIATPTFGRERPESGQHFALLDGMRASFLISDTDEDIPDAADWAWSSNVRHHVSLKQTQIIVSSNSGSKETFARRSVESKLSEFLRYLEIESESPRVVGAIDHLVRIFRKHRATLRAARGATTPDLESFLYLLAITQEQDTVAAHHHGQTIVQRYALGNFDPTSLSND